MFPIASPARVLDLETLEPARLVFAWDTDDETATMARRLVHTRHMEFRIGGRLLGRLTHVGAARGEGGFDVLIEPTMEMMTVQLALETLGQILDLVSA